MLHLSGVLRKEMGLTNTDVSGEADEDGFLRTWYAHMFYVERKKCVIFVNTDTFYTCAVFFVKRQQIRDLSNLFLSAFQKSLYECGFPAEVISRVKKECAGLKYAKSTDRRVIGVINTFVQHLRFEPECKGYDRVEQFERDVHGFLQWPLFASTRNCIWPMKEFCKYCGIEAEDFFIKFSDIDRPLTDELIASY